MAKVGGKAQGQDHWAKFVNARHKRRSRRGLNAVEKAAETKVRQAGRKICRQYEG